MGKRESDCRAEIVRYKPIKIAHPQHSHRIQPITAIFPLFSSNLKSTISLTFNISIWNLNPSTSYSLQHVCWVAWSRPVPLLTDRPPSTQISQLEYYLWNQKLHLQSKWWVSSFNIQDNDMRKVLWYSMQSHAKIKWIVNSLSV